VRKDGALFPVYGYGHRTREYINDVRTRVTLVRVYLIPDLVDAGVEIAGDPLITYRD